MKRSVAFPIGSILLVGVLCVFLYRISSIAIPFFLALVLAYFLDPAVDKMEARRIPRQAAVALVFGAFVLVAFLALVYLVPTVKDEIAQVQTSLPRYAENIYGLLPDGLLDRLGVGGQQDLQGYLSRAVKGVRNLSFEAIGQVVHFLSTAFSSTLGFFLAILGYGIIPFYLFYLLRDFDRLKEGVLSYVPSRYQDSLVSLGKEIDSVLSAFIRGQLTVCLLLAVLYSVGLVIIGVDLALVIGLFSGLAFIIPYVGTVLGGGLACLMALVQFHDWFHPMMVLGLYAGVQAIEGTVITPRIVGDRVGLHPLATVLAVMIGGELLGFLGLLLAVPAAASGKIIVMHLLPQHPQAEQPALQEGGADEEESNA